MVAYLEVTPDVMPAKIYVNETAQALQGFMEPFSGARSQPFTSNCSNLLSRVRAAGALALLYIRHPCSNPLVAPEGAMFCTTSLSQKRLRLCSSEMKSGFSRDELCPFVQQLPGKIWNRHSLVTLGLSMTQCCCRGRR